MTLSTALSRDRFSLTDTMQHWGYMNKSVAILFIGILYQTYLYRKLEWWIFLWVFSKAWWHWNPSFSLFSSFLQSFLSHSIASNHFSLAGQVFYRHRGFFCVRSYNFLGCNLKTCVKVIRHLSKCLPVLTYVNVPLMSLTKLLPVSHKQINLLNTK